MKIIPQSCEFCFKNKAEFIIYSKERSWKFCCQDCEDELYWISLTRLNEDWLPHLEQKNWFAETKEEFLKRYNYAKKELKI